jgi:AraC-like DNA-binding protein
MKLNLIKIFDLRSSLFRVVIVCVIALAVANILVYNGLSEMASIRQIQKSSSKTLQQIATTCETIISIAADTVNKSALFDFTEYEVKTPPDDTYEFQMSMAKTLGPIISLNSYVNSAYILNSYINSAYVYIAEADMVFDTRQGFPKISSLEQFFDREIFRDAGSDRITITGPRIPADTVFPPGKPILTLISPIVFKTPNTAWLAVNMNMERIYNDVFKDMGIPENSTLYGYNGENILIIHNRDKSKLFTSLNPENLLGPKSDLHYFFHRNKLMVTTWKSAYLNWTFVLESPIRLAVPYFQVYILINILLIVILFGFISLIMFGKKSQAVQVVAAVSDYLWKEALLDRIYIDKDVIQQLTSGNLTLNNSGNFYGLACVSIIAETSPDSYLLNAVQSIREKVSRMILKLHREFRTVEISRTVFVIVLKYLEHESMPEEHTRLAAGIFGALSANEQQITLITLSDFQNNLGLLPLCYRQCEDAFKYRICADSHIIDYAFIHETAGRYEFPSELARQLSNTIASGDGSLCIEVLEKIFLPLEKKNLVISDDELVNLVISLQNEVFKGVSELQGPVKIETDPSINIRDLKNMGIKKIKNLLVHYFERICAEINVLREDEQRMLYSSVVNFIEKNCLHDHLISILSVAEQFRISKNRVSTIVKEVTGLDFPKFINKKRIEYTKHLLLNTDLTIEEIAKTAGYNYSYYFIKIFKSKEKVTPEQYRLIQFQDNAERTRRGEYEREDNF